MSSVGTEKNVSAELRAIRLARERLGITRHELAKSLRISYKALEKIENGRMSLSKDRRAEILRLLGIDEYRLKRIKKAGIVIPEQKAKNVLQNSQRRSYRRVITKEVRVLKLLRMMKKIPQDRASALCQYSRPTIGHIENGRIEIPMERIRHIIASYGHEFSKFEELMKEEVLRDELISFCQQKLISLSEPKLKLVHSMLLNL